jgi:hypothetical protein
MANAPARWSTMALAITCAAVACAEAPPGPEVVKGFEGFAWGTSESAIPQLAGAQSQIAANSGLLLVGAPDTLLERDAWAGFFFDPESKALVQGEYRIPVELEECEREFDRYERHVEDAFLGVVREEKRPAPDEEQRGRYASDCEYFLYNSELEEWSTTFSNPDPPHDLARVQLHGIGRSLQLTITYQGAAALAWEEDVRKGRRKLPEPVLPKPDDRPDKPAPIGRG